MPFFPASPDLHSVSVANVAFWFQMVGVGISVYSNTGIDPIHSPTGVVAFELEHGKEQERYVHNSRALEQVRRQGSPVLSEHAGFWDLFVPVGKGASLRAILLTGPFLRTVPGVVEIREQWRRLTGHPPIASDPEFSKYVEATFSTPVLDSRRLPMFERLLGTFACLLEARGDPAALRVEARALENGLAVATRVDKMGEIAASMIGERTARSWWSQSRRAELHALGVRRIPDQVLVVLATARDTRGADPVDGLVRRHGFLRASIDLGKQSNDLVCGRLGDRGVVLLAAGTGSAERRKQQLVELAERAIGLADRRFGLRLHVGIGPAGSRAPLALQFEQALGASESALSRGRRIVHTDGGVERSAPLSDLRRELALVAKAQPGRLTALFDRYAETVTLHTGYLLEPVRAHLEAGFERAFDGLVPSASLAPKGTTDVLVSLGRCAGKARTVVELVEAFRTTVGQLVDATMRPDQAHRDRSLLRAVEYIREQYTDEHLSLARAARVAGFAPGHFSQLLQREHGIKFTQFVRGLRIERAKQLLMTTDVSVDRVAQLSGFVETHYFHRVFRRAVGTTPQRYRHRFPLPKEMRNRRKQR